MRIGRPGGGGVLQDEAEVILSLQEVLYREVPLLIEVPVGDRMTVNFDHSRCILCLVTATETTPSVS